MEMGEVADLVDDERAAVTRRKARRVREVVDDQLAAPFEQVEQGGLAARAAVRSGEVAIVGDAKAVEHFLGLFTLPEPFASAA